MRISAIVPTRGDVDLSRLVEHLRSYPEVDDVRTVTGNTPFNRYLWAGRMNHELVWTQDDDCVTDLRPVIEAYEPGYIVNAMTAAHAAQYSGAETLIGFGVLFHRSLVEGLLTEWDRDALFYRESDRIFATIHPHKTVFPAIEILPHAYAANRLYRQPDHVAARLAMERRIFDRTGIRA